MGMGDGGWRGTATGFHARVWNLSEDQGLTRLGILEARKKLGLYRRSSKVGSWTIQHYWVRWDSYPASRWGEKVQCSAVPGLRMEHDS